MVLEIGRPKTANNRLAKEIAAYDFLEALNIEFERIDHEPAMTMEICAEIDKVLGATICKNLFLCNRQQTDFYLLMMPDDKPFKTKNLSEQIGSSRLSFATPEHMEKYLNITPGSVSVLGLMNDTENKVTLLIDEEVLKGEFFGCHPLINTSSLKIKTSDLTQKIIPALGNKFQTVRLPVE
jgi:Ala-tRNA(Pro) deacylase